MVIEKHSKSSKQNRRRCFFEVAIDGEPAGRIIMELFDELVPKTTENFLMLCTGQAGVGKTTGKPLHYKGSLFHRVIKSFMIQGGDFSAGNGTGGESIYGGIFEDEAFPAKHDQSFLLSMANRGPDTNGSQFFITTQPAPHLDGKHVVFGKVISGEDVVTKIENLKVNNKNRPIQDVMIINCGQLVRKKDLQTDDEKNLDSNELSDESETDKKRRKKEKKRRRKHSEDTDYVEGDKGAEPPGPESMSSVKPEDLPEVPETNKFLLRRSKTPEGAMSGRQRRETSGKDASYRTSQSGHRIRGRGSIRYHTPSPEGYRARSRSITPPHWKREEKRLITLRELERMKKEREEHDAEMKRERDRHQNEDESMDTFGFRQPAFPVNSIIPPASYATIGKIGRAVDERRRSRSSERGRNRERDRERSRERSRRDRSRSRSRSHERRRDRSRSRSNRRRYRSRSRSRSRSRNRDRDRDHDRLLERREFERARRLSRDRRISPLRSSGKSPMRGERAEDFLRDREREPERSSRSRYRYERNAERRSPLLESSPPTRSLRRLQYRDEGEVSDTDDKQFHDHVRKRSRSPPRRQSRSPIRNGGFSPPVSPLLDPPKRRKFTEAKQVKNELELSALSDRADDEADNIGILTKKQLLKKKTEEMEEAVLHYTQLDEGPISAIDIDMSALLELAANDNKDSNERIEKQSPEIEKEVTAVHKIASEKHTLVLDEPEEIQPPQFRSFTKKLKQSKSEIPTTKKLVSPTVVEERQEIGMEMEEEDENITLKPTIKYPVESNGEVNEPQQKISEIAKSLEKEQTREVHPTEHKVHKTRSHKEELIVPDQKKAQTSEVVTTAHEEPSKSESVERAEIRMKLAGSPATKHSVVNQKKPKAFEQSASSESEGEESEKQLEKRSRRSRSSSGSSSASSRSSREKSKSSSPDGKSSGSESVASSKSGRRSSSSSSAAAASKKSSSATSSPSRASSKSSAVSKKSASPTTAPATTAVEETRRESSVKSESSSASSKSGVSKKSRDSSSSSSSSSASGSSAKKSAASSSSAASSASSRSSSPRRSRSRSRSRRRRSRSRSSDRYRRSSRRRSRSRSRRRRSRSRSSRYRSRRSRSDSRNRRRRSRSRSRSWRRRSRSRSRSSRRRR